MVIMYELDDRTIINRDVMRYKNLAQCREGFFALRDTFRNGKLYVLKGKERKLIAKFGK